MKRVVHVTTAHPPTDNRILRKECTALKHAGYDVLLVAPTDRDDVVGGIPVKAVQRRARRWQRMLLAPVQALRVADSLRPDVVHAHDPELIPALAAYRALSHLRGRPVSTVYDAHESLPAQVMGKRYIPTAARPFVAGLAHLLEQLADISMSGIVAATPTIAKAYSAAHTATIQNFPWQGDFRAVSSRRPSDPPQALYVGAISRDRGLPVMLEAAKLLEGEVKLVLAGPLQGDAATLLSEQADVCEYLGTFPAAEIPALIARSSVGLCVLQPLPNYLESQPTKVYEYILAGRPFVASDFPHWQSLFAQQPGAYFVDPDDAEALASAVRTSIASHRNSHANDQSVSAFSFDAEARHLANLYGQL